IGVDAPAIAAARADVAAHCDCSGFTSHADYARCSAGIVVARIQQGQRSSLCRALVQKSATKSSCGIPAAVSCCTTTAAGRAKCRISKREDACEPPDGGTACVGSYPSCGDACDANGCVAGPPISPPPASTPCTGACPIHTVFLILLENHD